MFYEERWINGVLMCRDTPNGEWKHPTPEEYSIRIKTLKEELAAEKQITKLAHNRAIDSRQRAEIIEAWKREQLAVEATWDIQAVGKLIGVGLGENIRPQIYPAIEKLTAELAAAREEIARLKTVPMKYRRMAFNAKLQRQVEAAESRVAELEKRTQAHIDLCVEHEELIAENAKLRRVYQAAKEWEEYSDWETLDGRDAHLCRCLANALYALDEKEK